MPPEREKEVGALPSLPPRATLFAASCSQSWDGEGGGPAMSACRRSATVPLSAAYFRRERFAVTIAAEGLLAVAPIFLQSELFDR